MSEGFKPPKGIFFNIVHPRNINSVKTVLDSSLPVKFSADWYTELANTHTEYTQVAYFNDIFTGVIASRLEGEENGPKAVYVFALSVLAAYRCHGIGTALMNWLLEKVKQNPEIKKIYLHVWTKNMEAIEFYKKFGFEITETIDDYYKNCRLDPISAHVLTLNVNSN